MVSVLDLQSGGPGFESHSGELLELLSVVLSLNPGQLAVFELLFVSKYLTGVPVN